MKLIIPKKIRIGGTDYKISQPWRVDWRNSHVSGQINYDSEEIKLKKGVAERSKEDTFFHEIAHGVLKEMEFNYPRINKFRMNEGFVQELGLVLRKTFLDLLKKQKPEELKQ